MVDEHAYTADDTAWLKAHGWKPDPWGFDSDPVVCIERVGRWLWQIRIKHGPMELVPYSYAWGKARAERKGRRQLARYKRRHCQPRDTLTIQG